MQHVPNFISRSHLSHYRSDMSYGYGRKRDYAKAARREAKRKIVAEIGLDDLELAQEMRDAIIEDCARCAQCDDLFYDDFYGVDRDGMDDSLLLEDDDYLDSMYDYDLDRCSMLDVRESLMDY